MAATAGSHTRGTDAQPRVGLVLGAGGTVGAAYHAGVLFSIEHHTGFDPRRATQIVGTSAGSLVGALLRAGVAADELVRLARRDGGGRLPEHLHDLHRASLVDVPSVFELMWSVRLPTVTAVANTVRHRSAWPWLLSWSRGARFDLQPLLTELDRLVGGEWPETDLKVCTVSASDGVRQVLDGRSGAALSQAVAASCAVPGLFRPQRIGGRSLVDGGVWSVTNVDALDFASTTAPIDEVWVVAPMAGATFRKRSTNLVHRHIDRRLHHELGRVPVGIPVRLFTPGPESSEVMGLDLMSDERASDAILAGFLEAGSATSR